MAESVELERIFNEDFSDDHSVTGVASHSDVSGLLRYHFGATPLQHNAARVWVCRIGVVGITAALIVASALAAAAWGGSEARALAVGRLAHTAQKDQQFDASADGAYSLDLYDSTTVDYSPGAAPVAPGSLYDSTAPPEAAPAVFEEGRGATGPPLPGLPDLQDVLSSRSDSISNTGVDSGNSAASSLYPDQQVVQGQQGTYTPAPSPTSLASQQGTYIPPPTPALLAGNPDNFGRGKADDSFQETVDASTETTADASCGWVEKDTNYPGNDMETWTAIVTLEDCCALCVENSECFAWSYKSSAQECTLKGNKPRQVLTRISDAEYTSGQPTQLRQAIPLTTPLPGQSLYCFALMLPFGTESVLLKWQFDHQASLFACDEYAIYSNSTMTVAPGLITKVVVSDLHCEKGGEFGTALNTPIFIAVWTSVVNDGHFKFHDWTIKVDPDAAFFPPRLRTIVKTYTAQIPDKQKGIYLNNCHRGMHGPLEVLSTRAVQTWFSGIPQCQSHFTKLCAGDCAWGEDMFLDQCLQKVLMVDRMNDSRVLIEDACDPPEGWQACRNYHIAAWHPFKDIDSYSKCVDNNAVAT